MKRISYLLALLLIGNSVFSQIPEDALRMSWTNPIGTARHQAIGGAINSLGGDITSTFVNPAGLGLYKTGEFVISPGFSFMNSKGEFRGTSAKADGLNKFNLGTSGVVFGFSNRYSRWRSNAVSFAVNRTANFNSTSYYKGQNDFSSISEQYVLDFASSGLSLNSDSWKNSLLISLPTKLALYEYLIDTAELSDGSFTVYGQGEKVSLLDQEKLVKTTGGVTELAFGYAANMDDRLYFGFGVGIPILNYSRTTYFRESDATGNTDNDFNFASYEEKITQKGIGVNGKLGLIAKPFDRFRLGLSIHTPTLYGLNENVTMAKMVTDLENYPTKYNLPAGPDSISLSSFPVPETKFDFVSPWKIIFGASYVLNEVQDINQQRGFISADVEYVTNKSGKFHPGDDRLISTTYYDDVNAATAAIYKNTFNFRVGGELKFKTIMARLGFAYFGNPYKDEALKANRMNLSGGAGYRNKGVFVDLTYVHSLAKDVDFPYRLSDKANTFANLKNNAGNLMLTVGFKF
ncbi:MAG: hypothetical protein H7Y31_00995 [Chitinophagaceae bacterium]|nr:hypothetical protein [Chitinophagaceae bacterium]